MKRFMALGLALVLSGSSCFAVTADDATHVAIKQALIHDIIKVPVNDVPKYCHFDQQIVALPTKSGATPYYLCAYLGEARNTLK